MKGGNPYESHAAFFTIMCSKFLFSFSLSNNEKASKHSVPVYVGKQDGVVDEESTFSCKLSYPSFYLFILFSQTTLVPPANED